jgi:hypothetical protein
MKNKILFLICLLSVSFCYSQQINYKAYESGFARLKGESKEMSTIQWMKSNAVIVLNKEHICIYPDKSQPAKKVVYDISLLKDHKTDETQLLTYQGIDGESRKCIITFERVSDDRKPNQLRIFSGDMVFIYNLTAGS